VSGMNDENCRGKVTEVLKDCLPDVAEGRLLSEKTKAKVRELK
jgi:hypothetical protein